MTPIAWIVKHPADEMGRDRKVHFSEWHATQHAEQFAPGVARVVALVDGDEAAAALAVAQAEAQALRVDAERWAHVKSGFSVMGLNIDGNHSWAWRGYHLIGKGPNIDAAIDAARAQKAMKPDSAAADTTTPNAA